MQFAQYDGSIIHTIHWMNELDLDLLSISGELFSFMCLRFVSQDLYKVKRIAVSKVGVTVQLLGSHTTEGSIMLQINVLQAEVLRVIFAN